MAKCSKSAKNWAASSTKSTYKHALAHYRNDLILEAPILVSHGSFKKFYFLDALLALGGILEFKASASVLARHRSQLLHYLMLAELRHGMLINVRPDRVTQEFVNNALTRRDRLQFKIIRESWRPELPGLRNLNICSQSCFTTGELVSI